MQATLLGTKLEGLSQGQEPQAVLHAQQSPPAPRTCTAASWGAFSLSVVRPPSRRLAPSPVAQSSGLASQSVAPPWHAPKSTNEIPWTLPAFIHLGMSRCRREQSQEVERGYDLVTELEP